MKNLKKGSFTVEAACLMPIILLVLFGVLTFFFHIHNRAWLTAAAYESAVSGSIAGFSDNASAYTAAALRSGYLGNGGFFQTENLHHYITVGANVQVTYNLDTVSAFGGFRWGISASGQAPILRPVPWIRMMKSGYHFLSGG